MTKKFLRVFLVCVLVVSAVSSAFAFEAYVNLKDGYLNVRSRPSINGKVVAKLDDGDYVEVIEEKTTREKEKGRMKSRTWYLIEYDDDGHRGWAAADYIREYE